MSTIRTPTELLDVALQKEEAAYRFYDRLLQRPQAEVVRRFLELLREEEGKHVRMIRRKMVDLRLGRSQ